MWLDPWLINIYENKIYGHIRDVVTFINLNPWVDLWLINIYKGRFCD